ncbi:M24 family metallopeptidase [Bradyrhizobium sp. USDA 4506]
MALHFTRSEYEARQRRLQNELSRLGLSGLLIFRQESMYWLTGYDTSGYSQFQCLWFGAAGDMVLLTRSADIRQARLTSTIDDVRLWVDRHGANPAETLFGEIRDRFAFGSRIGVEYGATTLNAQRGKLVDAAFAKDAKLEDASELISALRLIKSPAELVYVREAGRIADVAWRNGRAKCAPGNSESDILTELYGTVLKAGGDPAAGRFVCGAGDNALQCRYFTGKGTIGAIDQVTVEFAAAYRHYHVALMRTALVGQASTTQHRMYAAAVEALSACQQRLKPGSTFGDLFDAHAEVLDRHGFQHARLNACGYSLGNSYPPTWKEWPMAYAGNPVSIAPGMVIFLHMILLDSEAGLAMSLGETFIVTDEAPERLSTLDHSLPLIA